MNRTLRAARPAGRQLSAHTLGVIDFSVNHVGHFKALLWVELILGVVPLSLVLVWGSAIGISAAIFVIIDLVRGGERLEGESVFIAINFVFGLLGLFALWNLLLARIFDWSFSRGEARASIACLLFGIAVAISLATMIDTGARFAGWFYGLLGVPIAVAVRNAPFVVSTALGRDAT